MAEARLTRQIDRPGATLTLDGLTTEPCGDRIPMAAGVCAARSPRAQTGCASQSNHLRPAHRPFMLPEQLFAPEDGQRSPGPLVPATPVAGVRMTQAHHTRDTTSSFERQLTPLLGAAYGAALHMTRHKDDAEDLVQEAAVRAFRSFHTFLTGETMKI